ncbi:MAG: GTPase ObgE [Phycisphaerales bacterium]
MFVDRAIISVRAGHGGPGCVAFRRQKYEPKGGPNGGNGGRGGDVILFADEGCNTLLDFRGHPDWHAQNGGSGGGKQCSGLDGEDLNIIMPPGTLVFNKETSELIVDLQPRQRFVIAKGGGGGFGNEHYKSPTNQAPTYAHPGFPGDAFELRLDLKLIADVGMVGLPNAGKSTLLKALTRANPKIADYPFTTLAPQLGVAELPRDGSSAGQRRLVLADLPGLIEGASGGAGLGHDFLRHIERTRVLLHLIDVAPLDGSTPAQNYRMIRKELEQYSMELAERTEVICLNKIDLLPDAESREAAVKQLRKELKLGRDVEVFPLSGAAHMGTRALLETLWTVVRGRAQTWKGSTAAATPAASAAQDPVSAPHAGNVPAKVPANAPAPRLATAKPAAKRAAKAKTKPTEKPKAKAKPAPKPKPKAKPAKKSAPRPAARSKSKPTPRPKPKTAKKAKTPAPAKKSRSRSA